MYPAENPFQAPKTPLAQPEQHHSRVLLPDSRSLPMGKAPDWLAAGWDMVTSAIPTWIVIMIFTLAMLLLSQLATQVSYFVLFWDILSIPVITLFTGSLMFGCKIRDTGGKLHIKHAFCQFQNPNLLKLALLEMAGLTLILGLAGIRSLISSIATSTPLAIMLEKALIEEQSGLIFFVLHTPLMMACWFAPALVIIHNIPPVQAMRDSLIAYLKNIFPLLLCGLLFIGIALLGMLIFFILGYTPLLLLNIPLEVGVYILTGTMIVILGPLYYSSLYASYRDIFTEPEPENRVQN